MKKIVGVAQLYFMPHPLLEIVQRLMAHPVEGYLHRLEKQILTEVCQILFLSQLSNCCCKLKKYCTQKTIYRSRALKSRGS